MAQPKIEVLKTDYEALEALLAAAEQQLADAKDELCQATIQVTALAAQVVALQTAAVAAPAAVCMIHTIPTQGPYSDTVYKEFLLNLFKCALSYAKPGQQMSSSLENSTPNTIIEAMVKSGLFKK